MALKKGSNPKKKKSTDAVDNAREPIISDPSLFFVKGSGKSYTGKLNETSELLKKRAAEQQIKKPSLESHIDTSPIGKTMAVATLKNNLKGVDAVPRVVYSPPEKITGIKPVEIKNSDPESINELIEDVDYEVVDYKGVKIFCLRKDNNEEYLEAKYQEWLLNKRFEYGGKPNISQYQGGLLDESKSYDKKNHPKKLQDFIDPDKEWGYTDKEMRELDNWMKEEYGESWEHVVKHHYQGDSKKIVAAAVGAGALAFLLSKKKLAPPKKRWYEKFFGKAIVWILMFIGGVFIGAVVLNALKRK